jgi:hypothetical protein
VTATAICGYPAGLELVSNTQPASIWSEHQVTTYCPNGKALLSFGAQATGPLEHGASIRTMMVLTQPDRPWVDVDNTAGWNYSVTGYAICADPPAGLEMVTAVTPTDSAPTGGKNVTAFCPSGKRVLGTGA